MFNVSSYQSVSDLGVVLRTSQLLFIMVWIRQKINYLFGVFGVLVATIIILPFIPVLWFVVYLTNRRINKYNLDSEISISDATGYKSIKQSQSKLVFAIEGCKDLGLKFSKFFLFRGIGNQLLILNTSLSKISKMIDIALSKLDNVPKGSNGFELVSENTLWENRTKAYQYWV